MHSQARIVKNRDMMRAVEQAGGGEALSSSSLEALLSLVSSAQVGKVDSLQAESDIPDTEVFLHGDPVSYEAAMAGKDSARWKHSMIVEWNSILGGQTFKAFEEGSNMGPTGSRIPSQYITVISCSTVIMPISNQWVYKTKRNPDG